MKLLRIFGIGLGALALLGCSKVQEPVAPTADKVVERLLTREETPAQTQKWLVNRGFQPIARHGYGGIWPRTGPCYQTRKGLRFRAQTITRVCFVGDREPVVFVRETHGIYWSEVFPNDLSYNLNDPSGLGGISDETVELLTK